MSIELNIRVSHKDASLFGSININKNELIDKFDKLLTIQKFCEYTLSKKCCDEDTLAEFINDESRDLEALYAWTKSGNVVSWNMKKKFATVIVSGELHTLPLNPHIKVYGKKSPPDFCFR